MDPIQIVLILLALAAVWAIVELALVLRKARGAVDGLNRAVDNLNDTVSEARPMVAKLDGAVDELQPALARVDPLMKQLGVSAEALSADLLEVNAVLRDVSQVTSSVSDASTAVSDLTGAATEKVQKILGKKGRVARPSAPSIPEHAAGPDGAGGLRPEDGPSADAARADGSQRYYTYGAPAAGDAGREEEDADAER